MDNFPIAAEAADCVATGTHTDESADKGWIVEEDCMSLQAVIVCTAALGANNVPGDMHRGLQVHS